MPRATYSVAPSRSSWLSRPRDVPGERAAPDATYGLGGRATVTDVTDAALDPTARKPHAADRFCCATRRARRVAGLLVSLGAVAATTALIYPLREITPSASNGVVYMLAVLLVSTYWGLGLGLLTALASALAFNFFHIPPTGRFTIAEPQNYVALGVFLIAAAIASTVADLARARAREAERRREEADLAADLARLLLGGTDLRDALGSTAHRLAEALDLPSVAIELRQVDGDRRRRALPLAIGDGREATLLVSASIDPRDAGAPARASRPGARGAAGRRPRPRGPAGRGRGDAGPASLRLGQDGAPARRLARPAHAADHDRRRQRRGSLPERSAPRSARSWARASVSRRAGCPASSTSCSTSRGWRPGRPGRGASGARSRS